MGDYADLSGILLINSKHEVSGEANIIQNLVSGDFSRVFRRCDLGLCDSTSSAV